MTGQGAFSSELILATVGTYAAGTVLRQQEAAGGGLDARFGDLTGDTEVRLRYLAEVLALDRSALLHHHLAWHKVALLARGVPLEFLLTNLRCMRDELVDRLPKGSGEAPARLLDEAIDFVKSAPETVPSHVDGEGPLADEARRYLLAILEGRRADALALVDAVADAGSPISEIHTHLLAPVLRELGRMWQIDEIHVAEEHFGSQVTADVLGRLRARIAAPEEPGPRVLATTVEGDQHDIGISMVADQFAAAGWEALRLGASMPSADLTQAVTDFRAQVLVLSAHLAVQVRPLARLIKTVRAAGDRPNVPILVGGPPFAQVSDLWELVGADSAAASPADAIAAANRLVGGNGTDTSDPS